MRKHKMLPRGGALTVAATLALFCPGGPRAGAFEPDPNQRNDPAETPMNNLVRILASFRNLPAHAEQRLSFENPRDGWIFVSSTVPFDAYRSPRAHLQVSLEGQSPLLVHRQGDRATQEAFRHLPAGRYPLLVTYAPTDSGAPCPETLPIERLEVRAVPSLIGWGVPGDPFSGYGVYDIEFLRKDVLPNINTIVGPGGDAWSPWHAGWRQQGGRWYEEKNLPTQLRRRNPAIPNPLTGSYVFDYWTGSAGFQSPLLDGCTGDEFGNFAAPNDRDYPAYLEATQRLSTDAQFRDKKVLGAFCFGHNPNGDDPDFRQFMQSYFSLGNRICWEYYPTPAATQEAAWERIRGDTERNDMLKRLKDWEALHPGCVSNNLVALLGISSAPPSSQDVDPQVDFRVFLDMQMNFLANAEEARALCGLGVYKFRYADEEVVRWSGRLLRHYGVEGNRDMLSERYGFSYRLDHLRNSDFTNGLSEWEVSEAAPGCISAETRKGSGALTCGYYYQMGRRGDAYLRLRRSASRPNVLSQTIRNLEPGRSYSVRLVVGDHRVVMQNQSTRTLLGLEVTVENAFLLHEKTVESTFRGTTMPEFSGQERPWLNYRRLVFRATAPTAGLRLSDWKDSKHPGGPLDQELMVRYVSVRPYLED